MRAAYVCTDPGVPVFGTKGASVHVQEVVRALQRRGDAVRLHVARTGGDAPDDLTHVEVEAHGRPDGDDVSTRELAAVAASDALEGRLVATADLDLAYERYALWGGAGVRAAARLGRPGVLEVNAPLIEEQATHRELHHHDLAARRLTAAVEAATAVVCVSEPVADWVRARTGADASVHVIPNGVDVDRVRPGDARDLRRFTVGFLGTLKPWHGVEVLVDAVAGLRDEVPQAHLLVVGDGPVRDEVEARAAAQDVPLEVTGALAPQDVPAALHRMDVATAPYPASGDDAYFSPLKVLEYLAAGLPVVGSSVGQVPQLLADGDAGLLVEPGDATELAHALRQLARDPALRRTLGQRGRARVERHHTWDAVVAGSLAAAGVEVDARVRAEVA